MSVINIGGCPPTSLESKSIVPRHRLLSLLNEGTKYPLTLCVASSGWGKGTLLTSWANHTDKHVSWLQVDESDNEVAMFYQKLASSLLAMLSKQDYQSDPPPGASSLDLAWTLEQVSHITGDHVLILNDYHLVSNPEVHEAVIALIRWAPPSLHLIISSESTPPFPLSSFRAHSQLFEISALDLAFTRGDLRLLLRENLIDLKETSVERLMDLTGGWPAALHLALLQIKRIDPEDRDDFVSNIGARDRRITEWLNDAIYDTLPSRIRTFMLDTCILNEFSAPLCDTVRSTDDSGEYIVWLKDRGLISPWMTRAQPSPTQNSCVLSSEISSVAPATSPTRRTFGKKRPRGIKSAENSSWQLSTIWPRETRRPDGFCSIATTPMLLRALRPSALKRLASPGIENSSVGRIRSWHRSRISAFRRHSQAIILRTSTI